jgi:hypothetical protein
MTKYFVPGTMVTRKLTFLAGRNSRKYKEGQIHGFSHQTLPKSAKLDL